MGRLGDEVLHARQQCHQPADQAVEGGDEMMNLLRHRHVERLEIGGVVGHDRALDCIERLQRAADREPDQDHGEQHDADGGTEGQAQQLGAELLLPLVGLGDDNRDPARLPPARDEAPERTDPHGDAEKLAICELRRCRGGRRCVCRKLPIAGDQRSVRCGNAIEDPVRGPARENGERRSGQVDRQGAVVILDGVGDRQRRGGEQVIEGLLRGALRVELQIVEQAQPEHQKSRHQPAE